MSEQTRAIAAKTFSSGSQNALSSQSGKPNSPDFSFDPETGEPVLALGEEVIHRGEHNGLPIVITNHARRIYLCSLDQYEDKVGVVTDRALYLHFYPQAEDGPTQAKAASAPKKGK